MYYLLSDNFPKSDKKIILSYLVIKRRRTISRPQKVFHADEMNRNRAAMQLYTYMKVCAAGGVLLLVDYVGWAKHSELYLVNCVLLYHLENKPLVS